MSRRRMSAAVAAAVLLLLVPAAALAQEQAAGAQGSGALSLDVPAQVALGETVALKARLVDGGLPVAGASVSFSIPSVYFLGTTGDETLGQAKTDERGIASLDYEARASGDLVVSAEFAGDKSHAKATASAPLSVAETPDQLYVQQAGVRVPGLNRPPAGPITMEAQVNGGLASVVGRFWPTLSAWPLMAALLTIWSLYAFAISQVFGVVREPALAQVAGGSDGPASDSRSRASLGDGSRVGLPRPAVRGSKSLFLIPTILGMAVVGICSTLIWDIAHGPYTHSNLVAQYDPTYTRTDQVEVGPPALHSSHGFSDAPAGVTVLEPPGQLLLVGHGCAQCHGMDGQGSAVGPAMIADVDVVRQMVRNGPHGMPVFSPQEVPDEDITAIVNFLKSISK